MLSVVSPDKNGSKCSDDELDVDVSGKSSEVAGALPGIDDNLMAHHSSSANQLSDKWLEAERLVASERNVIQKAHRTNKHFLGNGHWPNLFHMWNGSAEMALGESSKKPSTQGSSNIIDTDSYAVVTFTSRQAALAARQCLADGCGLDRWREIDYIPIPPLADAPPWNILGKLDHSGVLFN